MKTLIQLLCLLAILFLPGCSNDNVLSNDPDTDLVDVKINLTAAAQPKTTGSEPAPNRYVVEVYLANTDTKLLDHIESSTGNITLRLPEGVYDFYFWADLDNNYNAANLQEVKVVENYRASINRVCYAGKKTGHIVGQNFPPLGIELTRPVAQLSYVNTGTLPQSKAVQITYKAMPTIYNVLTGTVLAEKKLSATAVYVAGASSTDPFMIDYVFPNTSETVDIKVEMDQKTKNLSGIPVKTNHKTNITAKFNE